MPQIIEAVAFLDDWMTRFGIEHVWVDLPNPV
jgi:hypothetical protein